MKKRSLFILIAISLIVLSSCWFPEKFDSEITINKDGTYSFVYEGILTFAPARENIAKGKKLSLRDDKEIKEFGKELLKDRNFKKAKYIGQGRFKVLYKSEGIINSPFYFLDHESDFISIIPTSSNKISFKGMELTEDIISKLTKLKMKVDGEIKVNTDAKVLKHNAKSKPLFGKFGSYEWQIKSLNDPAPYMVLQLQDLKDRDKLAAEALNIIQNEIESNQYIIPCNGSFYSLHYYKKYWNLFNASTSGRVPVFNALLEVKGGGYGATPKEITEVDKLNKIEWKGTVGYYISAMRCYPLDKKNRKKDQPDWSEWFDPSSSGSIIAQMESRRKYPLFLYSVLKKGGKWEYKLIEGVKNKLSCEAVAKYSSTKIEGKCQLQGRIFFNKKVITDYTSNNVKFWFRNETSGKSIDNAVGVYDNQTGTYRVSGLPNGPIGIALSIHETGESSTFPGNFRSFTNVDLSTLSPTEATSYNLDVAKIIHLIKPFNNAWYASGNPPYPEHGSPLLFVWKPITGATHYDVLIKKYRDSPYAFLERVLKQSTTSTSINCTLKSSEPNTHYEFSVSAYPIAFYMTTYMNGHGWDYRFKINGTPTKQTEMYVLFETTETGVLSPSAPLKVSGVDKWPVKLTVTNNFDLWLEIVPGVTKRGVSLKNTDCLLNKYQKKLFGKAGLRLVAPRGEIGYDVIYTKPEVRFYAEARFGYYAAGLAITRIFAALPVPGIGRLDDPVTALELWERIRIVDSIEEATSALKLGNIVKASKKLFSLLGEETQLKLLRQAFAEFKIEVSKETLKKFLTGNKILNILTNLWSQIHFSIQTNTGANPARVSFYITSSKDQKSVAEESKKILKSSSQNKIVGPDKPMREEAVEMAKENKNHPLPISNELDSGENDTGTSHIKVAQMSRAKAPMERLARSMAEKVVASGIRTVAVVDFTDLQGNVTELGKLIAEGFLAALINSDKGLAVVDKSRFEGILKAHKLTASGITDPNAAKKLGKVASVDAIVTGTVIPFGNTVRTSAKLLLTQTGKVICAYRENIPKPKAIKELLAKRTDLSSHSVQKSSAPPSVNQENTKESKHISPAERIESTAETEQTGWKSKKSLTKAVFSIINCKKSGTYRGVRGDVPNEIDLSDHKKAIQILQDAAKFAQEKCPKKAPFGNISVTLYQGVKVFSGQWKRNYVVNARNYDANKLTWREYNNRAFKKRLAKEKARKRTEEKRIIKARKKSEAEKEKRETKARITREAKKRIEALRRLEDAKGFKSIPEAVRKVIFEESKFLNYITLNLPREDNPTTAKRIRNYRDGLNLLHPIHLSNAGDIKPGILTVLRKRGLINIEKIKHHSQTGEMSYTILSYTDKIWPFICDGDFSYKSASRSPGFKIKLASRVLKAIDYKNENKATGIYTVEFSYIFHKEFPWYEEMKKGFATEEPRKNILKDRWNEQIPSLPSLNTVYNGKAKTYLDPNSNSWTLEKLLLQK